MGGRRLVKALVVTVAFALVPAAASAQASIAGVVKDSSGAVLPGVTVEASSPALIEKTRAVVTDGTGQYKIVDLRPGTYAVTFSLTGFSTVKREGIELTGIVCRHRERRAEGRDRRRKRSPSPASRLSSTSRTPRSRRVLGADVIDAIPDLEDAVHDGRAHPGDDHLHGPGRRWHQQSRRHDDVAGDPWRPAGRPAHPIDGLPTANAETTGNASNFLPNMGSTQEMTIDYSSGPADQETGGVRVNMIPARAATS